ncbi:MAG: potassium transporter TrkG [Acidimicrobiales bacterium]
MSPDSPTIRPTALLFAIGCAAALLGLGGRRGLIRRHRPTPARILGGLALTWASLVVVGAAIYLGTGTIDRLDDALVESAAGFSTTSVTTLDPAQLDVAMQLWRAATQWVGGLIGLLAGVVALPLALRNSATVGIDSRHTADRLAPTPVVGRQRVLAIYTLLTVVLGVAYALAGLGPTDSTSHALTTISTGGFSTRADSMTSFAPAVRVVATIGMIIAGTGMPLIWWTLRGRLAPVWRSTELRIYLALLAAGSALVLAGSDLGTGDAIVTTVSAVSTTGFASHDWTTLDDGVLTVLLLLIATGAMSASMGGLRVIRAWTLVSFAAR